MYVKFQVGLFNDFVIVTWESYDVYWKLFQINMYKICKLINNITLCNQFTNFILNNFKRKQKKIKKYLVYVTGKLFYYYNKVPPSSRLSIPRYSKVNINISYDISITINLFINYMQVHYLI